MHIDPSTSSSTPAPQSRVNVLLLYDQQLEGRRAMRLFNQVKSNLGQAVELRVQVWRLDLLNDPEWRAFVEPEVVRANLLMFAAGGDSVPTREVRQWLVRLLERKKTRGTAIAMPPERGGPRAAGPSPWFRFLRLLTAKLGIRFLAQSTPPACRNGKPGAKFWGKYRANGSRTGDLVQIALPGPASPSRTPLQTFTGTDESTPTAGLN
jgi:hypothetical protein